ncbi:MAG: cell division protein ZapA [Bacteroidales bacterium]|nr:cell division protein ZapA [Bacteroidales bacterium]
MEDSLSIKVNIAGRPYPLTVSRTEEATFRKAAQLINKQIDKYARTFMKKKDEQDFLAMVALQFTVDKLNCEENATVLDEDITSRLEYLDSLLSDHVEK